MGILVKHRKKDDKYRLWTTVADGWLTNWMSKHRTIQYLQQRVRERAESECEEIAVRFPDGYCDKNYRRISDERAARRYEKLLMDRVNQ